MKKRKDLFLSILSGLFLSVAWFEGFTGLILLFAWIPLLWIEDKACEQKESSSKVFFLSGITFLTWNILTTWWIKNATFPGMLVAILINTILFTMVFSLFHVVKRRMGWGFGYFGLLLFWISFEHFYLNAEISWTWLNLGNGLAKDIKIIQWYEYTGILGGTFWILLTNILIYTGIIKYVEGKTSRRFLIGHAGITALTIFLPIIISFIIFRSYKEKTNPVKVVVIQPNIDPYEKFINISPRQQTEIILDLASEKMDNDVDFIVAPETHIASYSDIDRINRDYYVNIMRRFLHRFPDCKIVVGMMLKKNYAPGEILSPTAQQYRDTSLYYDQYNSAVLIDTSARVQYYHKSQLVVGVEKMPYPEYLKFLQKLMLKLGGTFRHLAIQEDRTNLISYPDSIKVAPVICWENVFGEYVSGFIQNGANIIFVITNEGWWGDTPGYKQLNHLSGIRAIETRRSVVRSANTGISSIINQRGEIIDSLGWWKCGTLVGTVNANDEITFYSRHGDFLARIAYFFSALILLYYIVKRIIER